MFTMKSRVCPSSDGAPASWIIFSFIIVPSASLRADMDRLRAVYAGKQGLYRDAFGPVRLLEEDAAPQAEAS